MTVDEIAALILAETWCDSDGCVNGAIYAARAIHARHAEFAKLEAENARYRAALTQIASESEIYDGTDYCAGYMDACERISDTARTALKGKS